MKIRTNIRGGGLKMNHNPARLRIKTGVRAGGLKMNHNVSR